MKSALSLLFWLALRGVAYGALAVVQSAGVSSSGAAASVVTSPNITTTTGSLIVCTFSHYFPIAATPVTDSKSNSYANSFGPVQSLSDANLRLRQVHKENATGGSGHNFTLTAESSSYLSLSCTEVSDGGALDQATGQDQLPFLGITRSSGLTAATAQADEILIGGCSTESSGNFYVTSGWTTTYSQGSTGSIQGLFAAYQIVNATDQYAFLADIEGDNFGSVCLIGTYKQSAAPGAVAGGQTRRRH